MSLNVEQRGEKLLHLSMSTAINIQRNWVVERSPLRLLIVYFLLQDDRCFLTDNGK